MFNITDFDRIIRGANAWSTSAVPTPSYQRLTSDWYSAWNDRMSEIMSAEIQSALEQAARDFVAGRNDFDRFVDVREIPESKKRRTAEPVEDDSLYDKIDLNEVL